MKKSESMTIESNSVSVDTTPEQLEELANRARQGKLLDVPIGQAQLEAERYAEMEFDIKHKQEILKTQAERVMVAMAKLKQRVLSFVDEYGVRHRFEIVDSDEKLKHKRIGEPAA